jgi:hypothetical protein
METSLVATTMFAHHGCSIRAVLQGVKMLKMRIRYNDAVSFLAEMTAKRRYFASSIHRYRVAPTLSSLWICT